MKPLQSLSTDQYFTLNQVKYSSTDQHYQKRYPNQKLFTQQSLSLTNPSRNTKNLAPSIAKNNSLMQDVTRSEQLINLHHDFKEQNKNSKSLFRQKWSQKQGQVNIKKLKQASNDMLAKRSVQILIGIHKGHKTQYSKINRRNEQILKKHTQTQKQDHKQLPEVKFSDFSQQNLLEKYRQMIIRKQQGQPLSMINKLYQMDAITNKDIARSKKQGMTVVPTKSYETRKNSQLQYKISKIIQKPAQIKVVKEMLTVQRQTESKQTFRQEKVVKIIKKPLSRQLKEMKRQSTSTIKRQLKQSTTIEPSTPKISQMRIRASTNHKMEAISTVKKNPMPLKQQIKQIKPQTKPETKNQIQVAYPPPKKVTASAYIIYQLLDNNKSKSPSKRTEFQSIKKKDYAGKIHGSLNMKNASQIASLTKIMTCIVVIETCQKYNINPHEQKYKVGYFQSFIKGTTAQIEVGDIYTIDQLLKGLMLPSGNDASLALAKWTGNVLLLADPTINKNKMLNIQDNQVQAWASNNKYLRYKCQKLKPKRCYNRFIAQMNKKARLLGLQRTTYMNSHGLSDPHNKSSCIDLAILCQYAVQNSYFCQIVSCKQCKATIDRQEVVAIKNKRGRNSRRKINKEDPEQDNLDYEVQTEDMWNEQQNDDEDSEEQGTKTGSVKQKIVEMSKKQIHWINTHRLLQNKQGYFGIKTGVTSTAGPCLSSYYKIDNRKFIIIVLNCKKLSQRFTDTEILRQWLSKKQKIGSCQSKIDNYQ